MILHFDTIPHDKDIVDEIRLCKIVREYKRFPNDYLLDDLWHIVFSYLFGYVDHLLISVPLRSATSDVQCGALLHPSYGTYLSHFYGWEDGGDLRLCCAAMRSITVSGHYPLAFIDHMENFLYIVDPDYNRRCIVQMTFDPLQMPKQQQKWFAWHKSCNNQTFKTADDAFEFAERNKHIPMLETNHRKLWVFNFPEDPIEPVQLLWRGNRVSFH